MLLCSRASKVKGFYKVKPLDYYLYKWFYTNEPCLIPWSNAKTSLSLTNSYDVCISD